VDFSIGTLPISITFVPSDNMHPVPFEIIDDMYTEENETFTLSLSLASPSNSIQIGQSTTQVTIEDDDSKWLHIGLVDIVIFILLSLSLWTSTMHKPIREQC